MRIKKGGSNFVPDYPDAGPAACLELENSRLIEIVCFSIGIIILESRSNLYALIWLFGPWAITC
jgi:hypothetical protein